MQLPPQKQNEGIQPAPVAKLDQPAAPSGTAAPPPIPATKPADKKA
jgi:hypothetical protein